MGKIRLLNVLETTEKFLCIHRNYSSLSKFLKKIALLRVGVLIILYVIVGFGFINDCKQQYPFVCCIIFLRSVSTTAATLLAVVNGIAYSESYKKFSIKMDEVHENCKNNVSYKKKMMYLLILVLILTALFFAIFLWVCLGLGVLSKVLGQLANNGIFAFLWSIIELSVIIWRELHFNLEFYVFIILVRIIIIFLNVMKTNLKMILKSVEDVEDGLDDITYFELRRDLRKWAAAYNYIALCCDDLKKFYGLQILLSLSIVVFYFIMFSFVWVYLLASNVPASQANAKFALSVVTYLLILIIVLLYNAQKAQNEADCLKKMMSTLHHKSLNIPGALGLGLTQTVKDCRRCMETRPVRVRVLSTMPLQMSMLLAIISTAISNTIILLQLKHIV